MAGKAHVLAWYSAVSDALKDELQNKKRVVKLFEAALSVPIKLRLSPDENECAMASIHYAEAAGMNCAASGADSFWVFAERASRHSDIQEAFKDNLSGAKLVTKLKHIGISFKTKQLSETQAKALKNLIPFVADPVCKQAYLLAEVLCPELKEMTLLMRIAQMCSKRAASADSGGQAQASSCMAFIFDNFRVARLTGEFAKGEAITINKVVGVEKKSAGWAHILFKKQDFIEFLKHESELLDQTLADVEIARVLATPASILKHFAEIGKDGMVNKFLNQEEGEASGAAGSLNECFSLKVAERRDAAKETTVQLLIDLMWGTWNGKFDDEFQQLIFEEGSTPLRWHDRLTESSCDLGHKYRAFKAAFQTGPVALAATGAAVSLASIGIGASELSEADQQEAKRAQASLLSLRRQTVNFVTLPTVGGASGAEYSQPQLTLAWQNMRLGHAYSKKLKTDKRALIFSADLFGPNLTKHGSVTGFGDYLAAEEKA